MIANDVEYDHARADDSDDGDPSSNAPSPCSSDPADRRNRVRLAAYAGLSLPTTHIEKNCEPPP
jgi:hypothetical protein